MSKICKLLCFTGLDLPEYNSSKSKHASKKDKHYDTNPEIYSEFDENDAMNEKASKTNRRWTI